MKKSTRNIRYLVVHCENIDYEKIQGLSNIAISGLMYGKPATIGQANRISGVTYNDIALLIAVIREN